MKHTLLFATIASFVVVNAYASNIVTSKTYVDNRDALKVDIAQGVGTNNANVGKTLVVNSSGNLELGTPAAGNYVEDSITDGVTDKAPSENAVHDALAGKQNTIEGYDSANDTQSVLTDTTSDGTVGKITIVDDVSNDGIPTAGAVRDYVDGLGLEENPIVQSSVNSDNAVIVGDGNGGITSSNYGIIDDATDDGIPTADAVRNYVDAIPVIESAYNNLGSNANIIVGDDAGGINDSGYGIIDDELTEVVERERNGQIISVTVPKSGIPTAEVVKNYVDDYVANELESKQDVLTDFTREITYNGDTEDFPVLVNWADGGGKQFNVIDVANPWDLNLANPSDLATALKKPALGGAGLSGIPSIGVVGQMVNARQLKLGGTVNNASTAGKVVTATATAGEVEYVATYDGSRTYNASTDSGKIATAAAVNTRQAKKTCAGWLDGTTTPDATHTDANCVLWNLPD